MTLLLRTGSFAVLLASLGGCYSMTYARGSEVANLDGLNIARPGDRRGIYTEDGVINVRPDSVLQIEATNGARYKRAVRSLTVQNGTMTLVPLVGQPLVLPTTQITRIGVQRFSMNKTFLLIALLASPFIAYTVICSDPYNTSC